MRHFRSNRQRLVLVTVMVLGLGAVGIGAGSDRGAAFGAGLDAPRGYYLALGDSMTYGFQPTKAKPGAGPSSFTTGFVDVFATRLRKVAPDIEVVNYGCPGESTVTFVAGRCPAFADRIKLHDTFRGSQLAAALSFLKAHPGDVSPITVTLYGNDWLPILLDTCKGRVACARKQAPGATAAFGARLGAILRRLRGAAPGADIIVTGAWNPDPNALAALEPVYRSLEAAIVRAAAGPKAHVARMLPVFNPSGSGQARRARLCALTFVCSRGDPHPTDAGYRAMADAVAAATP
jgi:lysophospholipase L1-like esterase